MAGFSSNGNCQINIFGPQVLQNELLAEFIKKETGFKCRCCTETDIPQLINNQINGNSLLLWDCLSKGVSTLWIELGTGFGEKQFPFFVALFNVSHQIGTQFEKEILSRGVRGIFPQNCPPDLFIKGLKAVLGGELWFSRRALTEAILGRKDTDPEATPLTLREKEILFCIASGSSNDNISDDLNISPHTVKTHVYPAVA